MHLAGNRENPFVIRAFGIGDRQFTSLVKSFMFGHGLRDSSFTVQPTAAFRTDGIIELPTGIIRGKEGWAEHQPEEQRPIDHEDRRVDEPASGPEGLPLLAGQIDGRPAEQISQQQGEAERHRGEERQPEREVGEPPIFRPAPKRGQHAARFAAQFPQELMAVERGDSGRDSLRVGTDGRPLIRWPESGEHGFQLFERDRSVHVGELGVDVLLNVGGDFFRGDVRMGRESRTHLRQVVLQSAAGGVGQNRHGVSSGHGDCPVETWSMPSRTSAQAASMCASIC